MIEPNQLDNDLFVLLNFSVYDGIFIICSTSEQTGFIVNNAVIISAEPNRFGIASHYGNQALFWCISYAAVQLHDHKSTFGAWYARRFGRPDALIGLYVVFVAISQVMAAKIAEYDLAFIAVTAPAAVLVYSVTYLFTDVVNERCGRREVHKMILIAFVTQVGLIFFLGLGTELTPAPFWDDQEAWESIINVVPRITLASWVAFLVRHR